MYWNRDYPLTIKAVDTQTNAEYDKVFNNKEDFVNYVRAQFLTPGKYNLKNTEKWQEVGNYYRKTQKMTGRPNFEGGRYCEFMKGSYKYKEFFKKEKEKVKNGIIIDGWYLPPFYYWYLNYCPIVDVVKGKKDFGMIWDSDFWFFQYIMLCMLLGKHAVVVKARQRGYTLKIMALLYWDYAWYETSVNTIGAYKEDYVEKSWRFLEFYRKHINEHTAWHRGPTVPKALSWQEVTITDEGKPYGLDSKLSGTTFKTSAENGVGGSQSIFFYEEAGIAPTLLKTVGYVRPALERGKLTTGLIICSGAVGELKDAQDLKDLFYDPETHNFLSVTNIWDDNERKGEPCGLFVSEAYNCEGFMDVDGNSMIEEATTYIIEHNEIVKKTKRVDLAQLDVSQKPLSPKQAFDERTLSEWPVEKMRAQQERIKIKNEKNKWDFPPLKGLFLEKDGKLVLNTTNLPPEHGYPINPKWPDKRGVWTLYAPIPENPEKYMYYACVDAIEVDVTDTSTSIASVDIFQTVIEVSYTDSEGKERKRYEGDKLVATYRGRFDTAEATNEQIWLGIKAFNAWVFPERNKPNFINYMMRHGRANAYIARESDVPMFKDMNVTKGTENNNSKFGFQKGKLETEQWKAFKSTAKEYFAAEYGRTTFTNSEGEEETLKVFTGLDYIDDYWLLEEFCSYTEGKGNYDRIVSFLGALFICKTYQQNKYIKKRNEVKKQENKRPMPRPSINMLGGGSASFNIKRNNKGGKPFSMI